MSVEIGSPLQRQQEVEKIDLPPVAGVGHVDGSVDPLEQWRARQAGKVKPQSEQRHIMPGVEAMSGWETFVGWVAPELLVESVAPVSPKPRKPPKDLPRPENTLELSQVSISQIPDDVRLEEPQQGHEPERPLDKALDLPDLEAAPSSGEMTLDLGDLDLGKIIRAAADSVPEFEAVTPQVSPRSPELPLGLSPKLASVSPLAHPGRLPKGFALSDIEKAVLRACDGRRTTQVIYEADLGMNGAQLSEFLKRCARVKLVTFKSASR